MRDQLRKHKDKAAAYVARGKLKPAIKQYRSALQIAPDDVNVRQKLGETLHRAGDTEMAIREYQHVAGRYAADGFLLKAMAICKVILQLDPAHTETQGTLAKLYAAHHGIGKEQLLPASMSGALRPREKPVISAAGLRVTKPERGAKPAAGPRPKPSAADVRGAPAASLQSRPPRDAGSTSAKPARPPPPGLAVSAPPAAPPGPKPMLTFEVSDGDAPKTDVAEEPEQTDERIVVGSGSILPAPSDEALVEEHEQGEGAAEADRAPPPTGHAGMDGDTGVDVFSESSLDLSILALVGETSSPLQDDSRDPNLYVSIAHDDPAQTAEIPSLASDELSDLSGERADDATIDASPDTLTEDYIAAQFERVQATPMPSQNIPHIPLFSRLDPEAFVTLFDHLELRTVPAHTALVKEGERGTEMFIIVQGRVDVYREVEGSEPGTTKKNVVASMEDGAFFGEMALLADGPRMASVEAAVDTALLVIDRDTLNHIATLHPSVGEVALAFYKERLLQNLLRSSPLFEPFNDEEKAAIVEGFQSANIKPGTIILEKGQEGDGLYLLMRGSCEVFDQTSDGEVVRYPDLREGDVFGEISLLMGGPVTATVRTTTECMVLRLDKAVFWDRIMQNPKVRKHITDLTNERLRRTAESMVDLGGSAVLV